MAKLSLFERRRRRVRTALRKRAGDKPRLSVHRTGQHIYAQAFSYAPGVNPLEIIASNAIDWLVGNQ